MSSVPPRESRVMLTAKAIQQEILASSLSETLPGERELARRFRVGRVTIIGALKFLENERWISPAHAGQRRRILKSVRSSKSGKSSSRGQLKGKTIVVLAPAELDHLPTYERLNYMRMVSFFASSGISIRFRVLDLNNYKRPGHRLREFFQKNPAELYLLQLVSKEVQLWFQRHSVPALVLGSTWPGCSLPSVDMDQRALGVHAASLLERNKHHHVGILYPMPEKQGMRLFKDGFDSSANVSKLIVAQVDDTPESLVRGLRSLMKNELERPTVIILPRIPYVMTAITLLPSIGYRVPEDVSLLCLVYDETFEFFVPTVAGYRNSTDAYAKAVFEMAVKLLRHSGASNKEKTLIVPNFVPAPSLVPRL